MHEGEFIFDQKSEALLDEARRLTDREVCARCTQRRGEILLSLSIKETEQGEARLLARGLDAYRRRACNDRRFLIFAFLPTHPVSPNPRVPSHWPPLP